MKIEIEQINESPAINKAEVYVNGSLVAMLYFGPTDLMETEEEMEKIATLIESQLMHKTFPK